jgi:hypothetical protein
MRGANGENVTGAGGEFNAGLGFCGVGRKRGKKC